jgi:DNA polymerase
VPRKKPIDGPAAARQALESSSLMGVDFIPVALDSSAPPAEDAPAETIMPPATPSQAGSDKAAALAALDRVHQAECPHCTVAEGHTQTVFGEGDPDADIMFVGEAPGAEEDRTGRPFVGRAGQKLEDMIHAMGLRREDVYIANILKSRPPNNRTPLRPEIDACAPYLARQIAIIRPTVLVALGGPSSKFMLQTDTGITRLRGQWGEYVAEGLTVPVMPAFHPAYLLRNYTRETREKMWSDLQAVLARLGGQAGK